MKKSIEPLWWALFSAGGVISAILMPVLILIIAFAIPFGFIDPSVFSYERMHAAVSNPFIKIILMAVIALPFYHFAHRFYFTVVHTGLMERNHHILAIFCYGGAIIGTILAAYLMGGV